MADKRRRKKTEKLDLQCPKACLDYDEAAWCLDFQVEVIPVGERGSAALRLHRWQHGSAARRLGEIYREAHNLEGHDIG